jgi:hypothetical protein
MRDQVSYPYKTTGKTIVLNILIYVLRYATGKQTILNCMITSIP